MKLNQIKRYTIIVYTGGFYVLFPDEWLFRDSKAIFCPKNSKKRIIKDAIFYYKYQSKYAHIIGNIFRLWSESGKLQKELKHKYYRQKAIFKVYFWKGSFDAWSHGVYPEYYKKYKQLQLLDRKIMTFRTFLKYFNARTKKDGLLAWQCYTKKHFKQIRTVKKPKREPCADLISKKISETMHLIKNDKIVHITKIKSLNRLKYLNEYFDYDVFYEFARFIANKIFSYFENGKSLCIGSVIKEKKEIILYKAVFLINRCFDDTACEISLPQEIEAVFDEIDEMVDSKRIHAHARRSTLKDADLMAMRECLGYFINDRNKYPRFWKKEYDIAKYYCVSYADMRFRLGVESLPRLADILSFTADYEAKYKQKKCYINRSCLTIEQKGNK